MPEASLTRLSPSRMTRMRLGSVIPLMAPIAAAASGGEIMAPSTKPSGHVAPGRNCTTTKPTAAVVATTSPTASSKMARISLRKSRIEVKNAASMRIGGRKISSICSGSIVTCGMPGTSARPTPPMRNAIGDAIFSRCAMRAQKHIAVNIISSWVGSMRST